jgi:hypothetical protein
MSSGLAGSGPDVRTIDGEEFAAQRHAFWRQQKPDQP